MLGYPKVLLLSTDKTEAAVLQEVLAEHLLLTPAASLSEVMFLLATSSYDALFCTWSFHSGTWVDAVDNVSRWQPDLPVIILSRTAEEREWVQVLEAGAFDLLVPPFQEEALLAVLEQASASREARALRCQPLRLKASA